MSKTLNGSYSSVDEMLADYKTKKTFLWIISSMWRKYIWNRVTDLKWQIPTVLHRAFYGWGYADVWDLDAYLARIIYESLVYLKLHQNGYPITLKMSDPNDKAELELNRKNWEKIMSEMIYAFKLAKEIGEGKREAYYLNVDEKTRKYMGYLTKKEDREMKKGMNLFVKHFFNLWN